MYITEFLQHDQLMGDNFTGPSRDVMRSVLAGAFACPMDEHQRALFRSVAGDREPPESRVKELWIIAGRRAEKTKTSAGIAAYLCCVWAEQSGALDKLATGERAVVAIIATDKKQAGILLNYVRGFCQESPVLSGMIESDNTEAIYFKNRTGVEVSVANIKAVRSRTLLGVVFDECAFLRSDASANIDKEIYQAAVPGLATVGGIAIGISSPWGKRGLLYGKYRKHFGQAGDVLVVKGASRTFNPTLPQQLIDDAIADDPAAAKTEWLGEFRDDVCGFVTREVVDDCVINGRIELPPIKGNKYSAFVDPAGGSGQDAMTLGIAHKEDENVILDALRIVKPPFSPEQVTADFAELVRSYGCREVTGDRYGGEYPRELFRKHGVQYQLSDRPCSDIYRDSLPLLNSGRAELLDNAQLVNELANLERRVSRSGKDLISHPPNQHDDAANAAMGALIYCGQVKAAQAVFGTYGIPTETRAPTLAEIFPEHGPRDIF